MEPNDIIKGRYRLIKPLGSGSFGQVWLAEDNELGIQLAVKVYIALDSKGLDEFKTEFKNSRTLNHPNLLRADHYDVEGNHPYLVMNYCPDSLGNRLGSLDKAGMWKFIAEVTAGLSYLHSQDMIHRDIKPDNVLVNEHGDYVVSDFGLSKKMRSTLRRASARSVGGEGKDSSGTIGYMAPEMFSARPEAVKATDVWALGATIYEVATGDLPFCGQGGVMELGGAAIPELPEHFGPELNALMQRCLARDVNARPSAEELMNEARAHIGHDSIKAMPPVPPAGGGTEDTVIQNRVDERTILSSDVKSAAGGGAVPPVPPVPGGGGVAEILCDPPEEFFNPDKKKEEKVDDQPADESEPTVMIVKKNGPYRWMFYGMLALFVFAMIGMGYWVYVANKDINYYQGRSWAFGNALSDIQSIVNNGPSSTDETFTRWTSSNHTDNSTDYQVYTMSVSPDDVFTFDYTVDCESYDKFKVYVSLNDQPYQEIKLVCGRNKSGTLTYKATGSGSLDVKVEYAKDYSISSGDDKAQVYNVKLERSSIGEIQQALDNVPYYF